MGLWELKWNPKMKSYPIKCRNRPRVEFNMHAFLSEYNKSYYLALFKKTMYIYFFVGNKEPGIWPIEDILNDGEYHEYQVSDFINPTGVYFQIWIHLTIFLVRGMLFGPDSIHNTRMKIACIVILIRLPVRLLICLCMGRKKKFLLMKSLHRNVLTCVRKKWWGRPQKAGQCPFDRFKLVFSFRNFYSYYCQSIFHLAELKYKHRLTILLAVVLLIIL